VVIVAASEGWVRVQRQADLGARAAFGARRQRERGGVAVQRVQPLAHLGQAEAAGRRRVARARRGGGVEAAAGVDDDEHQRRAVERGLTRSSPGRAAARGRA
jgi:hypothetical protein